MNVGNMPKFEPGSKGGKNNTDPIDAKYREEQMSIKIRGKATRHDRCINIKRPQKDQCDNINKKEESNALAPHCNKSCRGKNNQ